MAGSLRCSRGCLNRGLSCWGTFMLVSFNSWSQERIAIRGGMGRGQKRDKRDQVASARLLCMDGGRSHWQRGRVIVLQGVCTYRLGLGQASGQQCLHEPQHDDSCVYIISEKC
jgi:hypothetical protein